MSNDSQRVEAVGRPGGWLPGSVAGAETRQFRLVNGHLHLPALRAALEAEVRKTVGPVMQDEAISPA